MRATLVLGGAGAALYLFGTVSWLLSRYAFAALSFFAGMMMLLTMLVVWAVAAGDVAAGDEVDEAEAVMSEPE